MTIPFPSIGRRRRIAVLTMHRREAPNAIGSIDDGDGIRDTWPPQRSGA